MTKNKLLPEKKCNDEDLWEHILNYCSGFHVTQENFQDVQSP